MVTQDVLDCKQDYDYDLQNQHNCLTEEYDDEFDEICSECCGSGEGMYDGSVCKLCGGSGDSRRK